MNLKTFQWASGLYCSLVGALMLVAPHQFSSPTYLTFQLQLPLWGALFLFVGVALIASSALALSRTGVLFIHLLGGITFLMLAWSFVAVRGWTGTAVYGVFGLGLLLAPLLRAPPPAAPTKDFFAIVTGVAALAVGLVVLSLIPLELPLLPLYNISRPLLILSGLGLLLAGTLLLLSQYTLAWPRWALWSTHLFVGAVFWGWMVISSLPNRAWTGIAFYGGIGTMLALLPWLSPRLKRIDPNSLKTRLAFALAVVAALPLIAATALVTEQEEHTATSQALEQQEVQAQALAQDARDYLELHRSAVTALAAQPGLLARPVEEQRALLLAVGSAYGDIYAFSTVDANGNILARSDDGPMSNISVLPVFSEALEMGRPSFDIIFETGLSAPLVSFGAPILEDGAFAGMVVGALSATRFAELLNRSSDSTAYLVNGEGRIIAHPDAAVTAEAGDASELLPVRALLNGNPSGSLVYLSPSGNQVGGYAYLPDLDLGVVVERPRASVLANIRAGRDLAFLLLIFGIVLAAGAGAVTAHSLSKPLSSLARAAQRLSHGAEDAPLPSSPVSEVAHLANAFGEMQRRLAARTRERTELLALEQRARIEAEEERTRLDNLFMQAPALMSLTSGPAHVLTRVNPQFRTAMGKRELTGKPIREALPELDGQGIFEALDGVYLSGAPYVVGETRLLVDRQGNGALEETWLSLIALPLRDAEGKIEGMMLHGVDLTQQVLARRQVEKQHAEISKLNSELEERVLERTAELRLANQELEAFAYAVSHDLRSPLSAISGYSQVLIEDLPELDETSRHYLRRIQSNTERMGALIDDILKLSRVSRSELKTGRFDLAAIARGAVQELLEAQPDREVRVIIPPELPVTGDPGLLRVALQNLLDNALKFSGQREQAVVEVGKLDTGAFFVRDNGVGFDMAHAQQLFQPFHRLHSDVKGTGIGLVTVRRIIERHGGRIWAESAPDEGSTFFFTLEPGSGEQAAS